MSKRKQAVVNVSPLDLETLYCAVEEHVRISYMSSLRRCVDAGLVWFQDNGRGAPVLTDAGRAALRVAISDGTIMGSSR